MNSDIKKLDNQFRTEVSAEGELILIPILKSKGQQFKEKHGYSKTLYRNMKKAGLDLINYSDSINEYKAIRKKRKKKEVRAKQKKHELSAVHMGTYGKVRTSKHKSRKGVGKAAKPYKAPVDPAA